jgi:hypothetical protein
VAATPAQLLPCLNAPLAGFVTPSTLVRVLSVVTMPACMALHNRIKHVQGGCNLQEALFVHNSGTLAADLQEMSACAAGNRASVGRLACS